MHLALTNPHAVLAALARRPEDVLELRLPPRGAGPAWQRVAERAARHGVRTTTRPRDGAGGRRGAKEGRVGGAEAVVREDPGREVVELFADAATRADGRGLWLAVDNVQDPRNLGAIFRSAAFFGVQGVLLTRDRSAPVTAVTYDTASGGLEHVPFAYASNLARDLAAARDGGLWILGAAEDADLDVTQVDRGRPWVLVVGNEERGLRRLTRESCDELCRVTPRGDIGSLNVSVAAAVLMSALTG